MLQIIFKTRDGSCGFKIRSTEGKIERMSHAQTPLPKSQIQFEKHKKSNFKSYVMFRIVDANLNTSFN